MHTVRSYRMPRSSSRPVRGYLHPRPHIRCRDGRRPMPRVSTSTSACSISRRVCCRPEDVSRSTSTLFLPRCRQKVRRIRPALLGPRACLDEDHFSPVVRQDHCGQRPGHSRCEVQYPKALQRLSHVSIRLPGGSTSLDCPDDAPTRRDPIPASPSSMPPIRYLLVCLRIPRSSRRR